MARGDSHRFFRAFLGRPGAIGAVAPSSKHLAHAMLCNLHLEPGQAVLELGPGTGAFTRRIRTALPDASQYLGIEIEARFVALLEDRFPDLKFVHGSAVDAARIVENAGLGPIRAVLSGLPFASLPLAAQDGIVASLLAILEPGAIFRTFQYVHAFVLPKAVRFRERMGKLFGPHARSRVIVRNLPPACVLTWTR